MQPHRIHLRGPWEAEWVSRADGCESGPLRLKMPGEWREQLGDIAGCVRFRRPFGQPTNLETDEPVFLCFDGVGGEGRVRLNGQEVGTIGEDRPTARFDVTGSLLWRNLLEVEVQFDPRRERDEPGGLWGVVALEIENESQRGDARD